jgi:hypothetical protein
MKEMLTETVKLDFEVACRIDRGEIPECLTEQMGPAGIVYQVLIQFMKAYDLSHTQCAMLAGYGKGMMLAGYILAQREHESDDLRPFAAALGE